MNAPDKALPHVVTGLIAERQEIAGQIESLQAKFRQVTLDLDHVEASLRGSSKRDWCMSANLAAGNLKLSG